MRTLAAMALLVVGLMLCLVGPASAHVHDDHAGLASHHAAAPAGAVDQQASDDVPTAGCGGCHCTSAATCCAVALPSGAATPGPLADAAGHELPDQQTGRHLASAGPPPKPPRS